MRKDQAVQRLFFNEPTRHWHFEEILRSANISRPSAVLWLQKLVKEGVVKRVKPKGKMPYYVGNYEHPAYQTQKRLFALKEFEKTGFLAHLAGLRGARTVILFGSMSRWDWHKDSDIDLFVYGDAEGFERGIFRKMLHREIETFFYKDKKELQQLSPALLRSIAGGYKVKGSLDFMGVHHDKG